MWCLDPVNSPALIALLRPHARRFEFDVAWVGEGWRDLVAGCHERLVAEFPGYELLNVKQKWGVLAYQAFPRPWAPGGSSWTPSEHERCDRITEEFAVRSETVCEWCGATAVLRDGREVWLTLCDECDARFPDPPVLPVPPGSPSSGGEA